jgi:hypothetical protein
MNTTLIDHAKGLASMAIVLGTIFLIWAGFSRDQRRHNSASTVQAQGEATSADTANIATVAGGGYDDSGNGWQPQGAGAAGASYSLENGLEIPGLTPDW